MDAKRVLKFAEEHKAKFLDLRFTDLLGLWHHFTYPIKQLSEDSFTEGFGFDGSSLRGWAGIHESDMLMIPDPTHPWIDPFYEEPTLCMVANVVDPVTKQGYNLDPRSVAQRAEAYLNFTGIADTAYFGPEAEFFIFDNVSFRNDQYASGYQIDSDEGHWEMGRREDNQGYHIRPKEGYAPVPPTDSLQDLRSEITNLLLGVDIEVECHHHEVATAGQCEIDFRFSNLVRTADNVLLFKYIVRNAAHMYGKAATFMPKPMFGDNGNGMHCHQSLWKGEKPLFGGDLYAGLSQTALYYIGGLLKHAKSIAAFASPSTNSYKRLVPGFEAPVNLAYSARNRSAAIRIPMFSASPKAKRVEFRPPDPSCNPYLAFSAMLLAGIDGVQNRIDPGQPLDKDIYDLPPEELANVPSMPGSLEEAIGHLEQDHEYLLRGDVFNETLIDKWIKYKREKEIKPLSMRPHPLEFQMYFDI